jgi:hypothetical protein
LAPPRQTRWGHGRFWTAPIDFFYGWPLSCYSERANHTQLGVAHGGSAPMTTERADYARVKRVVRELHKEFGITESPVNPIRIARGLGLSVYFVVFETTKKNVSGFFDYTENSIFVNKEEYPLRQTFTIAHELGHKVLHESWAKSSEYRVLLRDSDYDAGEPHEKKANAFAAHLLVPRSLLDKYCDRLNDVQLSTLFAVSVPMIRNRLSFEYGSEFSTA